ncbi:hypothetical protein RM531_07370 [Salinisphaera sp. P385]|uniref:Uncharacterized protein n=1 Tax=Spectribacter acetivorans TaxID=3075603 RepID=A0ABU3B765_9GAMM|nr:hypothetical protein [Salinisphaera sp. P385]MDT0618291.1 hypothetical protein [Salinisphaera sp. P385]
MALPLVVVGDLNIFRAVIGPAEAQAKRIVDADAVLPGSPAAQRFQAITRRRRKIPQFFRVIQLHQLARRGALDLAKTPVAAGLEKPPGGSAPETPNHGLNISLNVKR